VPTCDTTPEAQEQQHPRWTDSQVGRELLRLDFLPKPLNETIEMGVNKTSGWRSVARGQRQVGKKLKGL
jgi:hypothetical protein